MKVFIMIRSYILQKETNTQILCVIPSKCNNNRNTRKYLTKKKSRVI